MSAIQSVAEFGELIANIPGILGFYPEESLVICGFMKKPGSADTLTLGPVLRVDLGDEGADLRAALDEGADHLALMFEGHNIVATLIIAVTEQPEPALSHITEIVRARRHLLSPLALLAVDGIYVGAQWHLVYSRFDHAGADHGTIGEIVTAAATQDAFERTGLLPEACRDDLEARLDAVNEQLDDATLQDVYDEVAGYSFEPDEEREAYLAVNGAVSQLRRASHYGRGVDDLCFLDFVIANGLTCLRSPVARDSLIYHLSTYRDGGAAVAFAEALMRSAQPGSAERSHATAVFGLTALAQCHTAVGTMAIREYRDKYPDNALLQLVGALLDRYRPSECVDVIVEGAETAWQQCQAAAGHVTAPVPDEA